MKIKITGILIAAALFSTMANASENAEKLFDAKCSACHMKTKPSDMSKVTAPALFGVMRHIKMRYPDKREAVNFMVDYVLEPTKDKAVCMEQKIERFGLMPSQKGIVTEKELIVITEWMFDNFPPKDFRGNRSMKNSKGAKRGKGGKNKPFLINSRLPHLTLLLKSSWDDKNLNLTDKQKTALLQIRKRTISRIRAIAPEINRLEKNIATLSMSGEKVENIYPEVKKVAKLRSEATKLHLECIYDTKKVLTPQQVEYLLKR